MCETHPDDMPSAETVSWPERPIQTERIAVLASGGGTTFNAIGRAWRDGAIAADSLTLIATKPDIGAIEYARELDIPHAVVDMRGVRDFVERGDMLKRAMDERGILFAHAAGMVLIIEGEVLEMPMTNTHPAPMADDPDRREYGGPGMIGMRVHERIAADYHRGVTTRAGSSIHLVDEKADHGPIVRVSSYDIAARAAREVIDPQKVTAEHLADWTQADERKNNVEVLRVACKERRLRRLSDIETA
ncbi:MAG: formyltransferase family protein [Patescibacteria group bacterium]